MAIFKLRDRVQRIGHIETRTVEEIREGDGEPMYSIQLGLDFATRVWARESELEAAQDFAIPRGARPTKPSRSKTPPRKGIRIKVGKQKPSRTRLKVQRKKSTKRAPRKRS